MPSSIRCTVADLLELDLARMLLPDDLASRYSGAIQKAREEMAAVERGESVNRHENRPVGHYWLRDPDRWLNDANPDVAQAARRIQEAQREIADFAQQVRAGHIDGPLGKCGPYRKFLLIGIGGSALGPQLLYQTLRRPGRTPRLFFFDNTDPEGFERTLGDIDQAGGLGDTLAIVVSKSGGTRETRNGMLVARQAYIDAGLTFEKHAVAVTMPEKSALAEVARGQMPLPGGEPTPWLRYFPLWEWIGGRTSIFAAVGLLPAALLGFDWWALLAGARRMDQASRASRLEDNPALLMATAWHHAVDSCGLSNMVVLPYSDLLGCLGMYLQQLTMESLGKDGKGISVYGNKGSTDQHSFVQQLREGRPDFFGVFVRTLTHGQSRWARFEVEEGVTAGDYLAAFQEGTARALHAVGRPSMRLTVDRIDEDRLGAIIALFERAVGYYAAMIDINAYHQPGVEAGKRAAAEYLKVQQAVVDSLKSRPGHSVTPQNLAEDLATRHIEADGDLVRDILERVARSARFGLHAATGSTSDPDAFP